MWRCARKPMRVGLQTGPVTVKVGTGVGGRMGSTSARDTKVRPGRERRQRWGRMGGEQGGRVGAWGCGGRDRPARAIERASSAAHVRFSRRWWEWLRHTRVFCESRDGGRVLKRAVQKAIDGSGFEALCGEEPRSISCQAYARTRI